MRVASLVALLLLAACSTHPTAPTLDFDAAVDDDAGGPCSLACAHLRALSCPEGLPSPGGVNCSTVCARAGGLVDVACIQRASTVAYLAPCGVRCVR